MFSPVIGMFSTKDFDNIGNTKLINTDSTKMDERRGFPKFVVKKTIYKIKTTARLIYTDNENDRTTQTPINKMPINLNGLFFNLELIRTIISITPKKPAKE